MLALRSANIGHSIETKTCVQKLDTTLSLQTHGHIANYVRMNNEGIALTVLLISVCICMHVLTERHTHAHTRTRMHRLTCRCVQTIVRKLFTVHH